MRTFVLYNDKGEVQSVARVDALAEGVEHPFFIQDEKQKVLEVKGSKLEELPPAELHDHYRVDTAKQKLVKKPAPKG